ncbi:lectin MOA-related protein [Hyphococcus sp.]|uniref:lectin MOA-related protein n=1 Tax=Hyphococcus sp. TaxID=2038636 RepID=UPI003D0B1DF3
MRQVEEMGAIKSFVIQQTRGRWASQEVFLNGADRYYWLPQGRDLSSMLSRCHISHFGNLGEVFDCDEYACTFKSKMGYLATEDKGITGGYPIAAGIFWGTCNWSPPSQTDNPSELHAANWFVTRENRLVWIEPQFNNAKAQSEGKNPIIRAGQVRDLRVMIF